MVVIPHRVITASGVLCCVSCGHAVYGFVVVFSEVRWSGETRIRAAANSPIPTGTSPILSVVVPSGADSMTLPRVPGVIDDRSRKSSIPSVNSSSSGIR